MKWIIFIVTFLLATTILKAQVFTSIPNQTLAQGASLNFSQSVTGLPTSSNNAFGLYEVTINLLHPLTSDVRLYLQSPAGNTVILAYNHGTGANFTNAKFRRYADSSIMYCTSPFSAVYMCRDNNFADFTNGQNPNGTWTLIYLDNVNNTSAGVLQSWSLNFIANPNTTSLLNAKTNLPIFKINTFSGTVLDDPKEPGLLKITNNYPLANSFNALPNVTLNVGIELQGYTSSGGDKPNYDIELHTPSGLDTSYPLLGMNPESDYILKGAITDDWLMKDALTFELSNRMKYYAPDTRYIELFINDEYKGVYIAEEKVKRDSNRVSIKKLANTSTTAPLITGGYILEINPNGDPAAWYSQYQGYQGPNLTSTYEFKMVYPKLDSIPSYQLNYIHNFTDSFETALHNSGFQDPINGWRKYADEKSFINFLIVSEYSTNYDTYARSTYLYKENIVDGNKLKIGPPWDADRGYDHDTGWVHIITHGYWIFPFWWQQFRQDSLFNKRLACRYNNMRKKEISDTAFTNFIDNTNLYIRHALQRNTNRWQNYLAPVSELKTRCLNRMAWMDSKLSPVVYPPNPLTTTNFCTGIGINIFQGNQYTYNFKPGPDTSYFVPTSPGQYIASVTSTYGCETEQIFTIVAQPTPNVIGNTAVCANTNSLYKTNHISGSNYNWIIYGGNVVSGCGITDSQCIVHWNSAGIGTVQVTQQVANCSGNTSKSVTINECTSVVNVNKEMEYKVYPYPAKEIIIIETQKSFIQVEVKNILGKIVLITTNRNINIQALQAGIYFLAILDENNKQTIYKIIKE